MAFETLELGPKLLPFTVPFDGPVYRRILRTAYVRTWRAYPDVWKIHVLNGQFEPVRVGNQVRTGVPATMHCVAQALRAEALGTLLGLPDDMLRTLIAGVLLTDSYKLREWAYMTSRGPSWDTYNEAQELAKKSWRESGLFDEATMEVASSVAHETLLQMEILCDNVKGGARLDFTEIMWLIAHYVDDISRNHDWVEESDGFSNMLDVRMMHNAGNATYRQLNREGRTRLHKQAVQVGVPWYFTSSETTYEAQARVGHRVERLLVDLLYQHTNRLFSQVDLPVIIDNVVRRSLGLSA